MAGNVVTFSGAAPATVRAEINRGIAAARAQRAAQRVEEAVRDIPRRRASQLRADRLDEYRIEYETRAWGWLALGVAIGASVMLIALAVML